MIFFFTYRLEPILSKKKVTLFYTDWHYRFLGQPVLFIPSVLRTHVSVKNINVTSAAFQNIGFKPERNYDYDIQ